MRKARPSEDQLGLFDWKTIDRQDLTGLMAEIADLCGLEAVKFLCERFGGDPRSVRGVPSRRVDAYDVVREDLSGWMLEVADRHSLRLAQTLIDLRPGEMIYIPVLSRLEEAVKARQIKRLYNGSNAGDLAVQFRMPRRKVVKLALSRK